MATVLAMTKAQPKGLRLTGAERAWPRFININGVVKIDTALMRTIRVMAISRSVMVADVGKQMWQA